MYVHAALTVTPSRSPFLLVPLLAGLLLFATGCSSTHRVTAPSEGQGTSQSDAYGYSRVTEDVSGRTVRVFLRDGTQMELKNVYVGPDSTTGSRPTGGDETVPTSSLQKIELVDRGAGFWQGAGIGLSLGFFNGIIGAASTDGDDIIGPGASFAIVSLATGLPLSLLGGLIGVARGQRDVYRFPKSPSQSDTTAVSTKYQTERIRHRKK